MLQGLFSKSNLKNASLVLIGTLIVSVGVSMFMIPFKLVTGGVSGIAIIVYSLISGPALPDFITVEVCASVINWVFFFLGLFLLGKAFAAKTLIFTIFYPIFLMGASYLTSDAVFGGFFNLAGEAYADFAQIIPLISAVFGGAFLGVGVALTFLGGGSSGGIDVITLTLCKHFKKLRSSYVFFCIDSTIILVGVFVVNNLVYSLLGIVCAFVTAISIDRIFPGSHGAFIAEVITEKQDQLSHSIINRLHRTTTVVSSIGGYSGKERKLVRIVFAMREYNEVFAIISEIDPSAFVTVHRAYEINGEGWSRSRLSKNAKTKEEEQGDADTDGNG